MPQKKRMVGWYDPAQLAQTALRVAISTTFGQFADKREALAAANPIDDGVLDPRFDYAGRCPEGDFWLDFVADTGDGWNSTYAVARLVAEDALEPSGTEEQLPRGRILVMGGDQVYPTPSVEEYADRFTAPYEQAYLNGATRRWTRPRALNFDGPDPVHVDAGPDLYVVPGNHDWYDGLRTFFHLFCRRTVKEPHEAEINRDGAVIGGRQTYQTRSYFALKLPHGWWLWGTDSQLEGYIDQPQIDFFQFVAEKWMNNGSKLILCAGTPDWEYVDPERPEEKYATLSYLSRLAPAAVDGSGANKGHQLKLVLSGDSHHYARFLEDDLNYITCGGGGAFLHPTHHLKKGTKRFRFQYPAPGIPYREPGGYDRSFTIATKADTKEDGTKEEALYPSRAQSHRLTAGNLLFAIRNWKFTLTLACLYLVFTWMLDFNARAMEGSSLPTVLVKGSFLDAMVAYWRLALLSPWPIALCAVAFLGYCGFADVRNGFLRTLTGGLHALAHAVAVTAATCAIVYYVAPGWTGFWGIAGRLIAAGLASGLASATIFGTYLWVSLSVFRIHWNEAFSSLAVQDYKSFLRLRIDGEGKLIVYPIGLTRVPSDRGREPKNPDLHPELIEGPIVIS